MTSLKNRVAAIETSVMYWAKKRAAMLGRPETVYPVDVEWAADTFCPSYMSSSVGMTIGGPCYFIITQVDEPWHPVDSGD